MGESYIQYVIEYRRLRIVRRTVRTSIQYSTVYGGTTKLPYRYVGLFCECRHPCRLSVRLLVSTYVFKVLPYWLTVPVSVSPVLVQPRNNSCDVQYSKMSPMRN